MFTLNSLNQFNFSNFIHQVNSYRNILIHLTLSKHFLNFLLVLFKTSLYLVHFNLLNASILASIQIIWLITHLFDIYALSLTFLILILITL